MKKGNIMRDVISSSQFTENVIKEYKKGVSGFSWLVSFLLSV